VSEPKTKTIGLISLGCPKNRVDSEVMLGFLAKQGFKIISSEHDAEVIVINTCGFIQPAKQESIRCILEAAQLKSSGSCKKLVVTGCLVERYREQLKAEIPEIDAVLGVNELESIVDICSDMDALDGDSSAECSSQLYLYNDETPRLLSTLPHFAYVKIAEGCDHTCSFCVIPSIRGRHRSRSLESIIREVKDLASKGVRELNLVSQDSTSYGRDIGLPHGLTRLLERLAKVSGIEWIRVHYTYPNSLDFSMLDLMASEPKICPYLDMPLQHISSKILKRMRRGGGVQMLEELLDRVRQKVPGVALRSTMIVGFPGETEDEFGELMEFCARVKFKHLGVFTYFDEEGTISFDMAPKVPEKIKRKRRGLLMRQQRRIVCAANRLLVGSRLRVLIDGPSSESELIPQGRTSWQAPEIDGSVLITDTSDLPLRSGEFYDVEVTRAMAYDLIGRVSDPSIKVGVD
jgi:ribosomal protein S12 methylthiotransferase